MFGHAYVCVSVCMSLCECACMTERDCSCGWSLSKTLYRDRPSSISTWHY